MENNPTHPTEFETHYFDAYDLDQPLRFGKYKGQSLRDVLPHNPSYLRWLAREHRSFWLTDEALAELPDGFFDDTERLALEAKAEAFVPKRYDDDWQDDWHHYWHDDSDPYTVEERAMGMYYDGEHWQLIDD